jgi:DNA-binding LacI/PurR family transcriptional regulator
MTITIRDVANRANLSITTVSRALDGYDDVAENTRTRVAALAKQRGYVPSFSARQMRRQRTDTIGFVISSLSQESDSRPFADPFISEFVAGLGDEATRQDIDLLVSVAIPGENELNVYRRWVLGRRVDGFVVNRLRERDPRVALLRDNAMPFVSSGRIEDTATDPFIEVDTRAGFNLMIQHLAAQGCKRIAFIGTRSDLRLQQDRYAGYIDGLQAAKLAHVPDLIETSDLTRQGGYQAALRLLAKQPRPDAILGVNDMTALGAMRAANDFGLQVGRDIAIAGFDDIDDAQHAQPPLTTLRQPVYDIARQLVQMLLTLVRDPSQAPSQIMLQPELKVRTSSKILINK